MPSGKYVPTLEKRSQLWLGPFGELKYPKGIAMEMSQAKWEEDIFVLPRVDQDTEGQSFAWVWFTEQLNGWDGDPKFKSSGSQLQWKQEMERERGGEAFEILPWVLFYPKFKVWAINIKKDWDFRLKILLIVKEERIHFSHVKHHHQQQQQQI